MCRKNGLPGLLTSIAGLDTGDVHSWKWTTGPNLTTSPCRTIPRFYRFQHILEEPTTLGCSGCLPPSIDLSFFANMVHVTSTHNRLPIRQFDATWSPGHQHLNANQPHTTATESQPYVPRWRREQLEDTHDTEESSHSGDWLLRLAITQAGSFAKFVATCVLIKLRRNICADANIRSSSSPPAATNTSARSTRTILQIALTSRVSMARSSTTNMLWIS